MTEMRMGAMARSVFTICSGDATGPATMMRTITSDEMIKIAGGRRKIEIKEEWLLPLLF